VRGYDNLPENVSQITNTATVNSSPSDGTDANSSNNTGSDTSPLQIADLQIVKEESQDPVFHEHDYHYTLIITNNGPATATNVTVHDQIPDGVKVNAITPDDQNMNCGVTGQVIDCTMPTMANGQTVSITVDVTGETPGKKVNTATVKADQQDPNRDNNSSTIDTLVDPADIVLQKTVDDPTPAVGQIVTFTIDVKNNGPDDATGLTVTDNMPTMFAVTDIKPDQGSCSGSSPIVCQLGNLANGADTKITIKAKVTQAGKSTNTVSSNINEYDPNPDNSTNIGVEVTASSPLAATGSSFFALLILGISLLLGSSFLLVKYRKSFAGLRS